MLNGDFSREAAQMREHVAPCAESASSPDLETFIANLRLVADHSPDLIFVVDAALSFVYLNPRLEHTLRYSLAELRNRNILLFPEELFVRGKDGELPSSSRLVIHSKTGAGFWLDLGVSPIYTQEKLLGWLGVARDVTSQRQAEQRLLHNARELSAVQVVVAEASHAIDLRATFDATLDYVLELLDGAAGAIFLVDQGLKKIDLVAHLGAARNAASLFRRQRLTWGQGIVGRVVATDEPVLAKWETLFPTAGGMSGQGELLPSIVCAPLHSSGSIVGAIAVGRRQAPDFTADDLRVLRAIGDQAGVVIENARLHDDVTKKADGLAALYRAGQEIALKNSRAAIVSSVVRLASELSASPATMLLAVASGGDFRGVAGHGVPVEAWRSFVLSQSDATLGQRLSEAQGVICADLMESPMQGIRADGLAKMRSLIAVPMRVHGTVAGALVALHPRQGIFGEEELALLSCFADQAAAALEQARLRQESEANMERVAALNDITKAVVSTLEPLDLFKTLSAQIKPLLRYDQMSVALLENDGQSLEVFTFRSDGRLLTGQGTRAKVVDVALGWVAANAQPLMRGDLDQEFTFPWDGMLRAWGMRSDVVVPLFARGGAFGALGLAIAQPAGYAQSDLNLLQQIASQISIAIENAHLYQQTTASLREVNALRDVIEFFSAELDLDTLLSKILLAATSFVQADSGAIALMEDDDDVARVRALHNLPNSAMGRDVIPGEGPLGQALSARQPVLVHNYGAMGRDATNASVPALPSSVAVPIWWQDKLVGTFALGSHDVNRRFGTRDSELLQLLAKHVAIAIENARLYTKSRELAISEERNRLARDIHDTLAQSLTGIVLQLETVADLFHSNGDEAWTELHEARVLARRSLDEARQSVWGLQPTPLQTMTLEQALEREMRNMARQAGLATHFAVKGDARALPAESEAALFRIAQEAFSNVRKHASAKTVQGMLSFGEQEVSLIIDDDGVGLGGAVPGAVLSSGFGLTSMRERARLIGGELRLESAPGRGTRLTAIIPYEPVSIAVVEPGPMEPSMPSRPANAIKVLVADDHAIARQGIRRMLEHHEDIAVVAEAVDGEEAVAMCQELRPDVVLMDLQMPRLNGVAAIEQIRAANLGAKVLIISTFDKDEFLFEGIKAGAKGYLLKDVPGSELAEAVRAVSRGESLLQGVVAGRLVDRLGQLARGEGSEELTEREMDVLRLLANGDRNKEIGRVLSITEKTVKFHVANIFRKLGAGSRTEALAIALERGVLRK